jgi:hypothetical protein
VGCGRGEGVKGVYRCFGLECDVGIVTGEGVHLTGRRGTLPVDSVKKRCVYVCLVACF